MKMMMMMMDSHTGMRNQTQDFASDGVLLGMTSQIASITSAFWRLGAITGHGKQIRTALYDENMWYIFTVKHVL
jgi:hypothetical protein